MTPFEDAPVAAARTSPIWSSQQTRRSTQSARLDDASLNSPLGRNRERDRGDDLAVGKGGREQALKKSSAAIERLLV